MASLDKSIEDKKQALLAKMTEEGWRIPVVFNKGCQARPSPTFHRPIAFRPHQLSIQLQNLQASLAPSDFIMTSLDYPNKQDTGIFLY